MLIHILSKSRRNAIAKLAMIATFLMAVTGLRAQDPLPKDSSTIFVHDTTTLYTKVDAQPQFPGGKIAWQQFLVKNLRYPMEAMDNEIMGETRISFIVDVDGTVSQINSIMGDPILAKESARIISLSGNWLPAIYQGQKVKAYHIQPILYHLETDRGSRRKKKH